jgi:hypothetical protein
MAYSSSHVDEREGDKQVFLSQRLIANTPLARFWLVKEDIPKVIMTHAIELMGFYLIFLPERIQKEATSSTRISD